MSTPRPAPLTSLDALRFTSPPPSVTVLDGKGTGTSHLRVGPAVRLHQLVMTHSFDEVMALVPSDYHSTLLEPFRGVSSTAHKLCSARGTLQTWEHLKLQGKLPTSLHAKAPVMQLTKEFEGTSEGTSYRKKLADAHEAHLKAQFEVMLEAKHKEIESLFGMLSDQSLYEALVPLVIARTAELQARGQVPDIRQDSQGNLTLKGWEDSPAIDAHGKAMRDDVVPFAKRIMALIDDKNQEAQRKAAKKKAVHQAADVEMADATAGPSIQSQIDKAVSAAVKKLAGPSQKGKSLSVSVSPFMASDASRLRERHESRRSRARQERSTQGQGQGEGPGSAGTSTTRLPSSLAQCRHDETLDRHERLGHLAETSNQGLERHREDEGEAGSAQDQEMNGKFIYGRPSTLPDWLLTVPLPRAINWIILNTSVDVLEAAQFKHYVHVSPGVNLPIDISHSLSVGMKYMSHSPLRTQLLSSAWDDFKRRLRWRLKFSFEKRTNSFYDPDYEVDSRLPKKAAPILPHYLELGLRAGDRFVNKSIGQIPLDIPKWTPQQALAPKVKDVEKFLVDNDYVVTNTDKNLGLCVSQRTWLVEQSKKFLADDKTYQPLTRLEAKRILDKQCDDLRELSLNAEVLFFHGNLADYLRSKITPYIGKSKIYQPHTVPMFYGIMKIHKNPPGFRPIVPCHSAIQNPAAKYVSKQLKPIVKSAPTVIHGSKDLAIKLSKLTLAPRRRYFILTGDVVAFYPNVNLDLCLTIVYEFYEEYLRARGVPDEWKDVYTENSLEWELKVFKEALHLGNTQLVFKYNEQFYLQLQGLAMGVADSPDLANLYGWYFERKANILADPRVPFYGRYIDDNLAIVYADSEQEAIDIVASQIQFDNCTITWSASDHSQAYLDMMLYVDSDNSLQHMPYRKAQNSHERIPWISYHPFDVKRGTFIGEMSRLATLSSKLDHYEDALRSLRALYITRGYPSEVVASWTRTHITERWQKRLNVEAKTRPEFLVLKTSYNTAWNYFNAKELTDTVFGYWQKWLEIADAGTGWSIDFPHPANIKGLEDELETHVDLTVDRCVRDGLLIPDIRKINILNKRIITSRKRTRNLFDLTSLWKRIVSTLR